MTRNSLTLDTVYSSAQCVLSVVGSIGVILLFAGIPQLIYSPVAGVGNLMTFLVGALLITTMVAGNSFLNYKYRRFERRAMEERRVTSQERGAADPEDKPPSYDAIITSDGLPPDYFTILPEKPPRYEEIASEIYAHSTTAATPPTITTISTTTTAGSTDTLTITSETSSPCAGGVFSMSSSCSCREVGGLPGEAQKETDTIKEGERPPERRGNNSAVGEKKTSEDNTDDGRECISTNQEAHEVVQKEEINHNSENMNTYENTSQRNKEGKEEGTDDRIRTSATAGKIKDRSQCVVQVTSFRGVAQTLTHMEESES